MKIILENDDFLTVKIRKRSASELVELGLPFDEWGKPMGTHGYRFDVVLRSNLTGEPLSIINPALEYLNFSTLSDLGLIYGGHMLDNPDILELLSKFSRLQFTSRENGKRTEVELYSPGQKDEMYFNSITELYKLMMDKLKTPDMQ